MGFYAIKVLLLAASILVSISSVVAADEPITIFGVNFDHSPDEAREILEDRFDCKFTYDDRHRYTNNYTTFITTKYAKVDDAQLYEKKFEQLGRTVVPVNLFLAS